MKELRYSSKLESEINFMSALIYAHLEDNGYWRKKIFYVDDLMRTFKTGKANMFRQLNFLAHAGYIEYEKPYENRTGKIKTLKPLELDSSVEMKALDVLPKFHTTRIKIITALSMMGQATANQIKHLIRVTSRSTISRVLLELQKASMIYSFTTIKTGKQVENIWRLSI